MPAAKKIVILGIDPGYALTGYAVLEKTNSNLVAVTHGVIRTHARDDFNSRLKILYQELDKIIKKYHPQILAIEELFFQNNAKTALKVGQARGVAVLTGVLANLQVYNFTPLQIKQAITSYGRADKQQMQRMIKMLLNLKSIPQPDDAADALAVAYTCAQTLTSPYANQ
jgi:crossover junction endodeoxyribonuclease RuvC